MDDLFRKEALEHAKRRLEGHVTIATPLSLRAISLVVVSILVAGLTFISVVSYTRLETVPGWVVPEGGLIKVATRQGGAVETLDLREGDLAPAGARLATIRLTSDVAGGDAGVALDRAISAEAAAAKAQSAASLTKINADEQGLRLQREELVHEMGENEAQIAVFTQRQELLNSQTKRAETVVQSGYMSQTDYDTLQANALTATQATSQLRSSLLTVRRELQDLDSKEAQDHAELAVVQAQDAQTAANLAQRRVSDQSASRAILTAPVAAKVVALPAELGQSVQPDATVAVLAPAGSPLIAELYVPSRAAGFIREGQEVRLMYQAFSHEKFGSGEGTVYSVSRTVLSPTEIALPIADLKEPVFRVRVHLKNATVRAYGQNAPLLPGMLLTADVIIDRRNLVEWLLDPLYAVGRR